MFAVSQSVNQTKGEYIPRAIVILDCIILSDEHTGKLGPELGPKRTICALC